MPNFGIGDVVGVVLILIVIVSDCFSQSSYVCPKKFVAIGRKCYYFSKDEAIWHDAHFKCRSLNGSLAVITKSQQEVMLRRYLNKNVYHGRYERWLGGRFNEKQSRWVWGENGKPLIFHGFSRMNANDPNWAWHCIIVDPQRQNKWAARSCVETKRYICQRPVLGKKKNTRSKCSSFTNSSDSRDLCPNQKVGNAAPGFLVKKPIKKNNYHVATFVCPAHMILVGRKCYFFSTEKLSWSNAYWACRDNKTKLAVITTKMQDNILRGFLKGSFTAEKHERWLGGIYDWKQEKWKWAMSGKVIRYKNFAKESLVGSMNNTHHCITLDPLYDNLWNSKNRMEEKHYICQAKSKSVVKYNKIKEPEKPDATVVIAVENDNNNETVKKKVDTTSEAPPYYNNEVTEKYIYNN